VYRIRQYMPTVQRSMCGVSDLVSWLTSLPPYWEAERATVTDASAIRM